MRASLNQFVARSVFEVVALLLLPSVAWLCLFGIARVVEAPWRSVATALSMVLCALATASSLKGLEAPADMFRGLSVWSYFGGVVLRLIPFYLASLVVGAALTYAWLKVWYWLALAAVTFVPMSVECALLLTGCVGVLVALVTPIPVCSGLWVVTHHTRTKFDAGELPWSAARGRRP